MSERPPELDCGPYSIAQQFEDLDRRIAQLGIPSLFDVHLHDQAQGTATWKFHHPTFATNALGAAIARGLGDPDHIIGGFAGSGQCELIWEGPVKAVVIVPDHECVPQTWIARQAARAARGAS